MGILLAMKGNSQLLSRGIHGCEHSAPDSNTVFALRREGRIEEALEIGREIYTTEPGNVWNVRALAWVLSDLVRNALRDGRCNEATSFMKEFAELPIHPEDSLLTSQRDRLRDQISPAGVLVARASAADKVGNLAELRR